MRASHRELWPLVHTAFAFLALPVIGLTMRAIWPVQSDGLILAREGLMFVAAYALWRSMRRHESLAWPAIGLAKTSLRKIVPIAIVGLAASAGLIAIWDSVMDVLHLPFGVGGTGTALPGSIAVLLVVILRAGVLEEFFFRGVAIGRMEAATGSRVLAALLPLLVFAGLHWNTGLRNMLGALALGAVLTATYFWKRNLLANIAIHCVIDLAPFLP